jgi:hypothetical protein
MVKVSEVRIGNFLLFDFPNRGKVQYRSERINNDFDGFRAIATINGLQVEKVYGIPLTANWLAKFGFEKIDKQFQHNWIIRLNKTGEHYSIQFADDKFWLSRSEFDAWCYVIRDVEYVHELQNLYYALTGEELVTRELKNNPQ